MAPRNELRYTSVRRRSVRFTGSPTHRLTPSTPPIFHNKTVRMAAILVPLGVALATAGGIMYDASITPAGAATASISSEPRHPVTQAMLTEAALMSEKVAP